MDIQVFDGTSLKLKIKKTTFAVDPKKTIQKFDADAVLMMDKTSDQDRINNFRVVINEIGEYEVSGVKVSGLKAEEETMFVFNYDNSQTILVKSSMLDKVSSDKIGEYNIAIINVDTVLNPSIVTAMEPRVIILYGEKSVEGAKALGKEGSSKSSKISILENKLPEEIQVMLLG